MFQFIRSFSQAIVFFVVLLGGFGVQAHELRSALAEVSFQEDVARWHLVLSQINLEALISNIEAAYEDTDESVNSTTYNSLRRLEPERLRAAFDEFSATFHDRFIVQAEGVQLALEIEKVMIPDVGDLALARDSTIIIAGPLPQEATELVLTWDTRFGDIVVRTELDEHGNGFSAFLSGNKSTVAIPVTSGAGSSWLSAFVDYAWIGFKHILPLGLDHILFVVGLFLLSVQFRPLLIQITSFTVAHTITLALGVLGVVNLPAEIVEPLIALSIVYVAVENIISDKLQIWRPIIVFLFGLLHGLGFAGVLSELGFASTQFITSLIAFNVGVELGQLAVLLVCFLAIGLWFGKKTWYRHVIVVPGSLIIAIIGAYWFVERIL